MPASRELKEKIDKLKTEEQAEERKGNLQRVAEIRYGLLRQAEEELNQLTAKIDGKAGGAPRMLREEVDEEDIARIVSKWTGIPVSKMLEGEVKKLVTMEDRLRQRVVGQDAGSRTRGECDPPLPRRTQRSQAPHRLVHLPRPHRSRQNRTRPRSGGISV